MWTVFYGAATPDFLSIAHNIRGGWLLIQFEKIFGTAGLLIALGIFGFWLICLGIGGVWRLIDDQASVMADIQGLHFHPSIGNKLIEWRDVRSVRVAGFSPVQVQFELSNRYWSTMACFTSRAVRLNILALGVAVEDAKWKVEAVNKFLDHR